MTNILELAERGRRAGLHVKTFEPVAELPDTATHLGMPMDPELADLFGATNGCIIGSLFVSGVGDVVHELIEENQFVRDMLDDFPMLHNVLLCAGFNHQATELAIVPVHADEQGRHPVVIVDLHEEAFIWPLASTLNRGLELIVDFEILSSRDKSGFMEPFPCNAVPRIRQDTRLMELIRADAFAAIGGVRSATQEWYDILADPNYP